MTYWAKSYTTWDGRKLVKTWEKPPIDWCRILQASTVGNLKMKFIDLHLNIYKP